MDLDHSESGNKRGFMLMHRNKNKTTWPRSRAMWVGVLCAVFWWIPASVLKGDKKYEAYIDMLDKAPWYDGVKAQIDYVEPPVNSIESDAWCGLDNNDDKAWFWAQAGWAKGKDKAAKVYWEYRDENGRYGLGYAEPPTPKATEVFEVVHDGADMIWKRQVGDNTVYKKRPWTDFDSKDFCKAQYGAEIHDSPNDHTPGGKNNKNDWFDVKVRRTGSAYAIAPLANQIHGAANGHIEKYDSSPPGLANFRTWDDRD